MFYIEYSGKSRNFLKKADKEVTERIIKRIDNLKINPVPNDVKFIERIEGDKVFRYRVGDYRVLYKIKEKDKVIFITKIDKRSRIYN